MKKRFVDATIGEFLSYMHPLLDEVKNEISKSNKELDERLKNLEKPDKSKLPNGDAWLVIEDVAKMTNRSVHTIRGYVYRNEIPFKKKGSLLEFKKSDIIKWWEKKGK